VDKLGKYTNLERIGRGTMGVVYRAHDGDSLGVVAIKVMSTDLGGDQQARGRFIREARVAASLDHPNIIDIHGMGEEDGRPYIVMEYLEGEDLVAVISRGDRVPLERRLELMKQVASALAYAHSPIATSSPRTSSSLAAATCGCSTSGWPASRARR